MRKNILNINIRMNSYECYKWTNQINNKAYVGWCKAGRWNSKRWKKHQDDAIRRGSLTAFHSSVRKYGPENFKGELLGTTKTEEEVRKLEIQMIKKHKTLGEYNMNSGGNGGGPGFVTKITEKEAFENKIEKINGCWLWVGNVTKEGYGRFYYRGKMESAAKASVRIFKGIELPKGRKGGIVTAICMNPLCMNPSHLEIVADTKDPVKLQKWSQFRVECSEDVVRYRVAKAQNKRKLMAAYEEWLKTT